QSKAIEIIPETRYGYLTFLRLAFHKFTKRAILGATLMITQSFLYNAIFFTYALVLINFYHVPSNKVPLYGLAFSIGNLCGPLVLGPLFDSWGRKQMIAGTYLVSGVLLAFSAVLFDAKVLNAATQTIMWVIIFFFASAGASAAYLTVSETWPIEIRAEAIAVFFAIGSIAGPFGPLFYRPLIGTPAPPPPLCCARSLPAHPSLSPARWPHPSPAPNPPKNPPNKPPTPPPPANQGPPAGAAPPAAA